MANKHFDPSNPDFQEAMDYNALYSNVGDTDAYLTTVGAFKYQKKAGNLDVDGKAGPKTRESVQQTLAGNPPWDDTDNGLLPAPKGKGIFIRTLGHVGTPLQMISDLKTNGFSWVCLQVIKQRLGIADSLVYNREDRYPNHFSALRNEGIDIHCYGWPMPEYEEEGGDEMAEYIVHAIERPIEMGAGSIIHDVEKQWKGKHAQASEFMKHTAPTAQGAGLSVGITTYGAPWFHAPTFPYEEFAELADFAVPQNYDMKNQLGPGYPTRSHAMFREFGYDVLIPAGPAWNKTPEQLKELFDNTPMTDGGYVCWDWYNLFKRDSGEPLIPVWAELEVSK